MADEHPNTLDRDWRLRKVTVVANDYQSPSGKRFSAGSVAEVVGFAILPDGSDLSIPVPDPAAIYLSLAQKELQAAIEYQDNVLPSAIIKINDRPKLPTEAVPQFYDCLQSMAAGVIFSYTAIEVFANSEIPNDYSYSFQREDKKCTEHYSKVQIERFISLDSKLDKVLPAICKVKSPKGTRTWEQYVKLKKLRDRLIHLKTTDWQSRLPERANEWIWTYVLSTETRKVAIAAFDMIAYYFGEAKPRWAVRFEQAQEKKTT